LRDPLLSQPLRRPAPSTLFPYTTLFRSYRDWKAGATVFERLGLYHLAAQNLIGVGEPARIEGADVEFDLLPTLGVNPIVGRLFTGQEDKVDAPGTILLSYRLWQTQFGGAPSVIGRPVQLDSQS